MTRHPVDIIIVSRNSLNHIKRCIMSIRVHTKRFNFIITVVDNASSDRTSKFLKDANGKINLIRNRKNLGFSKAFNIGLKQTNSPCVAAMDDDIEVTDGWLDKMYLSLDSNKRIGIVGPKFLTPKKNIWSPQLAINPLIGYLEEEIDRGQRDYIKETDIVYGACWLMKRELLKSVGYFDEDFFPCVYEDADYCLRARKTGYKIIYNGGIGIVHHHLARGKKDWNENRKKFFKKWGEEAIFPFEDTHQADKYNFYGYLYLKMGKRDKAFKQFRKAEKLNKKFAMPKGIIKQWLSA